MPGVLGAGLDFIDVHFLEQPGLIATGLLHGADGIALIDPGPSTTLPRLKSALAAKGFGMPDVRAILLTHIHLDHAGATGSLIAECPRAQVLVHERGAPHLIDPSRLMASAARLYGADMDRLWGEVRGVPAERVRTLGGRDTLDLVGHRVESAWTPGHAWHHVSYFLPAAGIAFVGDAAGICRPTGRVVLPPTPPPDIDLGVWRESTKTILAWNPDQLFLTHFGPQGSPRVHMTDLWQRMDEWSSRVQTLLRSPGSDDDHARQFTDEVTRELSRETSPAEADAYMRAARFDFSFAGLARYWKKK